ncbi:MAG: tail fiber domain-containing protein [Armatimonadetes bacterium]|nr:tail fiber domain-containing protein [Armatimonadota bacterium]
MKRTLWLGFVITLATLLASPVIAQPFTYQGFLKQNGQPVNGTRSMTFKLFTALTGGSQVGDPITQNVNVQNGLFTVELNFGTVWDGSDRYLEISVDGNTLSPRVKINPAPYASYAGTAFFAQRPWQTSGSNIFYTAGNVGIGTSSPSERLHVNGNIRLADDRSIFGLDQLVGFNDLRLYGDANGGPDVYIAANGNVGIGTGSPSARLSLGGDNANTKIAIWDGGASGVMGFGVGPAQFRLHLNNSNDRFSFLNAPNGAEVMTVGGNGFVGIGTNNPLRRLHVAGGDLRVDGGQIQTNGWMTLRPGVGNSDEDLVRFLDGAGNETLRIHFNGNVGINWGNPWYRLHVGGDGYFTGRLMVGSDGSAGQLHVASSGPYTIYAVNQGTGDSGGIAVLGKATATSGNYWGVFGESQSSTGIGVRGQAIAESGTNTGVWGVSRSSNGRGVYGEAVSPSGTTYGVFGVSLSPNGRGVFGWGYATTGANYGVYGESRSPDGRAVYGLASATSGWNFGVAGESRSPEGLGGWFGSAGKKGARIVGQGHAFHEDWPSNWQGGLETWDIVCAAIRHSWIESRSDARLKRDIQPLDSSTEIQRLLSLRPVSFYWRDERLPQTLQYGFLAQELREVFPELVSEGEDPQKTLAVNYQALIPLLVNALQVQQEQIRQQEARIQRLEAELQRLRASAPNK